MQQCGQGVGEGRAIFARERDFNLRVDSYFASTLAVLAAIGLVQVTLLFGIVRVWRSPPGNPLGQWAVVSLLVVTGTTTGLLVLALSRTEEVAVALVPLVVIPQIILAGVVAPLSGPALLLARVMISAYNGQQGLEALIPGGDLAEFGRDQRSLLPALLATICHIIAGVMLSLLALRFMRTNRR